MTNLADLKYIAQAASEIEREWVTGIEARGQCGHDLEAHYACLRAHRDNPRKDHFQLAETDRRYMQAVDPETVLRLIEAIEVMREAIGKYASGGALQVKPEKAHLYEDPADKVAWLQRSMSDYDDRIVARAALDSVRNVLGE